MDAKDKFPKIILTEPGEMVMSRTDECPPGEIGPYDHLSLTQKLKNHYNKGLNKKKRTLDNALTPDILNRTAVPMFLFTFVATMKIGVLDVMPLIYADSEWAVLWHQIIVIFIGTQMLINWLGIRYMTSTYITFKQRFGKNDAIEKDKRQFNEEMQKHISDSSAAVLMPLLTENNEKSQFSEPLGRNNKIEENRAIHIERTSGNDLEMEVDKANKEMHRRLAEETSGIKDLISKEADSNSSQSATENTLTNHSKEGEGDNLETPKPVVTSGPKIVTYPYWSWTPCYTCASTRPPRCHHCPLCKACILKRDHHCYFAGSCVGYRNLRYFYIFLVWSWLGSMWATLHGFPYISMFLWEDMSYVDVIFVFAIIRWLFGYLSFQAALSVTTLSLLIYFDIITTTFIYSHSRLINWGLTSFEKVYLKKSLVIQDTRSTRQKLRAVFGKNWFLMFFIPIHFFVEPDEDPVKWPHIKVIRN